MVAAALIWTLLSKNVWEKTLKQHSLTHACLSQHVHNRKKNKSAAVVQSIRAEGSHSSNDGPPPSLRMSSFI